MIRFGSFSLLLLAYFPLIAPLIVRFGGPCIRHPRFGVTWFFVSLSTEAVDAAAGFGDDGQGLEAFGDDVDRALLTLDVAVDDERRRALD